MRTESRIPQAAAPEQQDDPAHEIPEVMTADEVARLLRVNRKTVYAAFQDGRLPGGRHIGRALRFSRARLVEWLAEGQAAVSLATKGRAS